MSKNFKVLLIKGARQVGKTTLLKNLFPKLKIITFDPIQDLYGARSDPDLFLDSFQAPIILDEIQYAPELIAAIKRRVDQSDLVGQYLLTGSQNLSVIREISESMAGRVGIIELESMSLYELNDLNNQNWLDEYIKDPKNLSKKFKGTINANILQTIWRGSLPGLLEIDESLIPDYFSSYLQTYVERDIRVLGDVRDLSQFTRFLGICAASSSHEINKSQIGRDIGLSPKQAGKWLDILIHSYQWREIPAYSGNTIKRLSNKAKGIFTDVGLACNLQRISSPEALASHPNFGFLFETFCINNIMRLSKALSSPAEAYHWRTNGGAEVDLILERDGKLYPIEIKSKTNLTKHDSRGIKAFLETYKNQNIQTGLIIYAGDETYSLDRNIIAIPWDTLLKNELPIEK